MSPGQAYTSPGGYLDPHETDQEGLITRLNECLGIPDNEGGYVKPNDGKDWKVAECLSTWWRSNMDTFAVGPV
jgi:cleavage and polyadenylation specificity factor subunit 5